ncbi:MAG: phosphoenolpyruvate--protein phosphotransferase [Candidatus Dormibacteria bacterium]
MARVSLVLVSHSALVAEGVAELAGAMASSVRIVAAGGLTPPETALGTDASRIAAAIREAWSPAGVLVLMDLGSAILSAELARDMLDADRRSLVRLSDAPLVEGAVAAAVAAEIGESLSAVAEAASAGLQGKTGQLEPPSETAPEQPPSASTPEEWKEARFVVDLPMGLHARPAARLIQAASNWEAEVTVSNATAGRGPVSARSLNAVASLQVRQGQEVVVRARGAQAKAALNATLALAAQRFGEPHEGPRTEQRRHEEPVGPPPSGAIAGIAASPGIALGSVVRLTRPALTIPDTAPGTASEEDLALTLALQRSREELLGVREATRRRAGEYQAGIIDAHILFLEDPELVGAARHLIVEKGMGAARAWAHSTALARRIWDQMEDPHLRLRAADLEGVAQMVLAHLLNAPQSAPNGRGLLVAEELTPTDTATLSPGDILGIATAGGGPTSHTVILARSLGIPAVVGLGPAVLSIPDGTPALLDGDHGFFLPRPDLDAAERAGEHRRKQSAERATAQKVAHLPAATTDGVAVEVAANIGSLVDARAAVELGADGVGLLRTEFLFQEASEMPDERTQVDLYEGIAEVLGGRPLTIRTLDVGADKPLSYLVRPAEDNPALGVRGIRLGLEERGLLLTQLRAIQDVSQRFRLRVMFPMVATAAEVIEVAALLGEVRAAATPPNSGTMEVGIMVEVPAAALAARALASLVDFMSIGTNDLSQYTMAADRTNPGVAALADPLHPAVLRLIKETCLAGAAAGIWVGVCGELAGEPSATELLLGLGVRELSMSPRRVAEVKQMVRSVDSVRAGRLADRALGLRGADEVRQLLTGDPVAGR